MSEFGANLRNLQQKSADERADQSWGSVSSRVQVLSCWSEGCEALDLLKSLLWNTDPSGVQSHCVLCCIVGDGICDLLSPVHLVTSLNIFCFIFRSSMTWRVRITAGPTKHLLHLQAPPCPESPACAGKSVFQMNTFSHWFGLLFTQYTRVFLPFPLWLIADLPLMFALV